MTKTNYGLTVKNMLLLGYCDNRNTYTLDNTGKRISSFTAYLSHHLTGKVIVKNDVKVQPPMADMLQPPMVDGQHANHVNICQHSSMTKVKHVQTFTQFEEVPKADKTLAFLSNLEVKPYRFGEYPVDKILTFTNRLKGVTRFDIGIYQNQTITFDNKLKDKKVIAKDRVNNYPSFASSKISRLVLAGYKFSTGVQSARAFFVRNFSMRSHLNGEAVEGHFRVCRSPVEPVCYPFQLCHQLAVNGKAPISTGVHNHA